MSFVLTAAWGVMGSSSGWRDMWMHNVLPNLGTGALWAYFFSRKPREDDGRRRGKQIPIWGLWVGSLLCGALTPALCALVCFGSPRTARQRFVEEGLAGEGRERIVGAVWLLVSIAVLWLDFRAQEFALGWALGDPSALHFGPIELFAVVGALAGGAVASLTTWRSMQRRRFVRDAVAGRLPGYRVTGESRKLVRVFTEGTDFRQASFEEALFELDAGDEVRREIERP